MPTKPIALATGLLIFGGVMWQFPLFHIVSLDEHRVKQDQTYFNATEFAEKFWHTQLSPYLDQAAEASTVIAELRSRPQEAIERFGRSVGVGRARVFCLRGVGAVVAIEKQSVGVSLKGEGHAADIVLQTRLLFGNTVRDASGLLDAGDFSNSQHFNEISAELNRIVETRVIPSLKRHAQIGQAIHFVACAQFMPDSTRVSPLRMIPLKVEIPAVQGSR
jgi:predicted lipoprotein